MCRYIAAVAAMALWQSDAWALRPYDSTDASVAPKGQIEIELGPAGYIKRGAERILVAPAVVVNVGISNNWEAVLEGRHETILEPHPRQSSLVDDQLALKGVLRAGSLQGGTGPSVATEIALLLPEGDRSQKLGGAATIILSHRQRWGTYHLNSGFEVTRDRTLEVSVGAIVEGPAVWRLRPAAELRLERESGESTLVSVLLGAIWQFSEDVAFDLGVRHAWANPRAETEARLGVTFALRSD